MHRIGTRWLAIGSIVVLFIGLGYWGVKALLAEGGNSKLVMATKPVTRGDIEITVRGWGVLQASEEQDVIAGAKGIIKEVFFRPGQQVRKGQVLMTIDAGSLETELKQKEIELELKRVEVAEKFGVSPDKVAEIAPESALLVKSPVGGRVVDLSVQAGADASGTICRIVDDSRLLIKLQLPEPFFNKVKVGQETTFMPDRFAGRDPGKVIKADPTPIAGEQTFFYEVWIEMPNPGLLKVGDSGILVIHTPSGDIQQKVKITSYALEETLEAPFRGKVKAVFVREGATVRAGDPILEFEPGEALLQAIAAQLEFKQLLVEVESLRNQMENLTVVSPMDGVALNQHVYPGQSIGQGNVITRISNFQRMNLLLRVDEMDVPKIVEGQKADLTIWGPRGREKVSGVVSQIGAKGDERDGLSSFNITVEVANPGFLRPGMGAEAQIFVSKKDNVLLCPVEALYKENEKWFVDIKDGKERKPVEIKIGLMNDRYAEILEGLTEGQEVVVGMTKEPTKQTGGRTTRNLVPKPW